MVPVLDKDKRPLMPCSEKRAKQLMEKGKAKPYWCKGIFCIILQEEPKSRFMQDIVIGIDPGSKFNGYTVKSEAHTLKNLHVNAITSVKGKMEERAMLRKSRRQRNTPYRKCRLNRSKSGSRIPPSTKARWQQHLNIVKWMEKLFKITHVVAEDIKAESKKGAIKWNKNFSPIEVGKNWFYNTIKNIGYKLHTFKGYETYQMRVDYNLKKNSKKDKECFYTHCVDSWCLANEVIGGHVSIDNKNVEFLKPLMYHRRKLHATKPKVGGIRRDYGGTMSMGIKRGTLVKHKKWGLCIIGGSSNSRISLHCIKTNKRLSRDARKCDLEILTSMKYLIK